MIYSIILPTTNANVDRLGAAPVFLGDSRYYSIQAVFSGSNVVGTFKLQNSVDGITWKDISGKSTSVTSSASTDLGDSRVNYPYVRFYWDYTSGTGNITVYATIKQNQVFD